MKSIIFIIFIIISFSAISPKNLRVPEIIKRSRNHPPSNPHIPHISNRNGTKIEYPLKRRCAPLIRRNHAKPQIPQKKIIGI